MIINVGCLSRWQLSARIAEKWSTWWWTAGAASKTRFFSLVRKLAGVTLFLFLDRQLKTYLLQVVYVDHSRYIVIRIIPRTGSSIQRKPGLEMDRNAALVRQMHRYQSSVSSKLIRSLWTKQQFLSFKVYIVLWMLRYFWQTFRFVKFPVSSTDAIAVPFHL